MFEQVLSPITGRVIGAKEIRVGNDKVGLTKLSVQVVAGLQLNILPDSSIENGYMAETSVTRKLTAKYQVCYTQRPGASRGVLVLFIHRKAFWISS